MRELEGCMAVQGPCGVGGRAGDGGQKAGASQLLPAPLRGGERFVLD